MISWVFYVAMGLLVGGAAGFFLARLDDFSKKERRAMQEKLDQAEKQMASYKHEVTEHFVATAGLINNMTESYQAVHEHLAKGALSLCDHQVAVKRLKVTSAESLEKSHDSTIESVAVKLDATATPQISAEEAAVTPDTRQSSHEQRESREPVLTDGLDDYEQEQPSLTATPETQAVQEAKQENGGQENGSDSELTEEQRQETEEQKALAEKQAAAMASRMVH